MNLLPSEPHTVRACALSVSEHRECHRAINMAARLVSLRRCRGGTNRDVLHHVEAARTAIESAAVVSPRVGREQTATIWDTRRVSDSNELTGLLATVAALGRVLGEVCADSVGAGVALNRTSVVGAASAESKTENHEPHRVDIRHSNAECREGARVQS